MKKLILAAAFTGAFIAAGAAELPNPVVNALPSETGWFDAFVVTWAQNPTQPYKLQLVNPSGITVTKNLVEELKGLDISLVEYQQDENTPNYPDARLVVTLQMLEAEVGATYALYVPAGAINVYISDTEYLPNEAVNYSFTLKSDSGTVLPEPVIEPAQGVVNALTTIKMSWTGKLGSLDLLNAVNDLVSGNEGETYEKVAPVTCTNSEGVVSEPQISFEWSSRLAKTDGAAGDILVITVAEVGTVLPDDKYIIDIPAGYLQISDVETGTLYNDEIILEYTVDSSSGISSITEISGNNGTIYNLKGEKVASNDLNNLPKGVYIINGKKVIK